MLEALWRVSYICFLLISAASDRRYLCKTAELRQKSKETRGIMLSGCRICILKNATRIRVNQSALRSNYKLSSESCTILLLDASDCYVKHFYGPRMRREISIHTKNTKIAARNLTIDGKMIFRIFILRENQSFHLFSFFTRKLFQYWQIDSNFTSNMGFAF